MKTKTYYKAVCYSIDYKIIDFRCPGENPLNTYYEYKGTCLIECLDYINALSKAELQRLFRACYQYKQYDAIENIYAKTWGYESSIGLMAECYEWFETKNIITQDGKQYRNSLEELFCVGQKQASIHIEKVELYFK